MKKSIQMIVSEHRHVLQTRERLEKMFSLIAECHVTVGGSYMLKYWCEAFEDREVSDYDFILHALPENIKKIEKFVELIGLQLGWNAPCYYDYKTFYMGHCLGLKVNIILKPGKYCPCSDFESLEDIINVKRAWCEKAIKQGRRARDKDVMDIATYEDWELSQELPF